MYLIQSIPITKVNVNNKEKNKNQCNCKLPIMSIKLYK